MPVEIRVSGLRELRSALRDIEGVDQRPELREALRAAATIVADDAQARTPVVSGRARASIRPLVSATRAYVQGGKASVPYYGWLDFGSRRPRRGNPRSRGPWSGSGPGPHAGRFIYPALAATKRPVTEKIADGLDKVTRKAGFR